MSMSRGMLALAATAALTAAVPAGAQATTFAGECQFQADYAFGTSGYSFDSGAPLSGSCSGSLNRKDHGGPAVWRSSGSGAFSCLNSSFDSGSGTIEFFHIDVDAHPQRIELVDTLTLVDGAGVAVGSSLFRNISGPRGGNAVETGELSGGACGSGTYRAELRVVNGSLAD